MNDDERALDSYLTSLADWERDAWRFSDRDTDADPRCEWCDRAVPDGASVFAPYCSAACEREAELDDALAEAAHQAAKDRQAETIRCPNCHGTGKAADCWYW